VSGTRTARRSPKAEPVAKSQNRFIAWAALAARAVGAVVFTVAGFSKITDPQGSVRAVRAYRLLPESMVHSVAYALPSFEIALAVLLLLGIATRFVGIVATTTLAVFVAAIASAAARGLQIDCGCFGGGGTTAHTHYTMEIIRDCLLLLVVLVIPLSKAQKFSVKWRWNRYPLAAAVLAVAALIGITASAAASAQPSSTAVLAPAGATPSGGIIVGDASAQVHLVIYEDPQCPICREFEQINGATLQNAVTQGKVSVEYRMRSFLGVESVRADNALAAAQEEGRFEALRETLFAHQPVERTGGYTTDDLLALGRSVGLTDGRYVDAVRSMSYRAWVLNVDDRASRDGNVGTPQIIKVGSGALTPQQTFDAAQFRAVLGI
jgi:protein-disulfide isomerase